MGEFVGRTAVDAVAAMLARSGDDSQRVFPPTELFNEGWMLRLVLDAAFNGEGLLPFELSHPCRWYSEARLASPFGRRRNSPSAHLAEGFTHADAVVGHFAFRDDTEAGLELDRDARQFVVIEAKMFSNLSKGTTRAPSFDQAARNVACMAWALQQGGHSPSEFESISFRVWAPAERLEAEPTFAQYLDREALTAKVLGRVDDYKCDPERHDELKRWASDVFLPMVDSMEIVAESWEGVLAAQRESLSDFYERCLVYNGTR